MRYLLVITFFVFGLAASAQQPTKSCSEEDFVEYIRGKKHCIAIQISGDKSNPHTLVVYLHGDVSRGGPSDYFARSRSGMKAIRSNGVLNVNIIRLGYYTSDKRYSSGSNYNRRDNTTKVHNEAILEAILKLKKHYGAKKVIGLGHSAGALSLGALIGKSDVFSTVILVSCPCDTSAWARKFGRSDSRQRRESPQRFVRRVNVNTQVIAITGAEDKNTTVETIKPYIAKLQKRGINAKLIIVPGAGHNYGGSLGSTAISQLKASM